MTIRIHALILLPFLAWLAGCADSSPSRTDAGGSRDASFAHDGGDSGFSPRDAAADAGDAGERCGWEPFPLWDYPDYDWGARRLSFASYCADHECPASVSAYSKRFPCDDEPLDAGADDAGAAPGFRNYWQRFEGCGEVEFFVQYGHGAEVFNFDAATGKLIGAAYLGPDDIVLPHCSTDAWVTGEIRHSCETWKKTACLAK